MPNEVGQHSREGRISQSNPGPDRILPSSKDHGEWCRRKVELQKRVKQCKRAKHACCSRKIVQALDPCKLSPASTRCLVIPCRPAGPIVPFPINLTSKLRTAVTIVQIAIFSRPRASIALKHSQDGGAESTVSQLALQLSLLASSALQKPTVSQLKPGLTS